MQLNHAAKTLCDTLVASAERHRLSVTTTAGARVIDFGGQVFGGLEAGCLLARVCLADHAQVRLLPASPDLHGSSLQVHVTSDHPLWACLGGQYAGWPVQVGKYFAMGSGPMRLLRGREEMLVELGLRETPSDVADAPFSVVGVLETDQPPNEEVVHYVAEQCGVSVAQLTLCYAPVTSIAGVVQVVARSLETALHKWHAVGLDPGEIRSGSGHAPLPPTATDVVRGIGTTNDAILYGGHVTLWTDSDQAAVDELGPAIPSCASQDYGKPFADTFKAYDYDFYKVDPGLFSPALLTVVNLRSGIRRTFGQLNLDVLGQSFDPDPTQAGS